MGRGQANNNNNNNARQKGIGGGVRGSSAAGLTWTIWEICTATSCSFILVWLVSSLSTFPRALSLSRSLRRYSSPSGLRVGFALKALGFKRGPTVFNGLRAFL